MVDVVQYMGDMACIIYYKTPTFFSMFMLGRPFLTVRHQSLFRAHYKIETRTVKLVQIPRWYYVAARRKKLPNDAEQLAHFLRVHFCFHISFCSTYPRDSSNRLWIVPLGQGLEASERDAPVTGGN